jgi:hypothetical protein
MTHLWVILSQLEISNESSCFSILSKYKSSFVYYQIFIAIYQIIITLIKLLLNYRLRSVKLFP